MALLKTGAITVGTTPVRVPVSFPMRYGVQLLADPDNTGGVFHGERPNVNATSGDPAAGYPVPGDGVGEFVPGDSLDQADSLYVVGSASGQKVYFKAS